MTEEKWIEGYLGYALGGSSMEWHTWLCKDGNEVFYHYALGTRKNKNEDKARELYRLHVSSPLAKVLS